VRYTSLKKSSVEAVRSSGPVTIECVEVLIASYSVTSEAPGKLCELGTLRETHEPDMQANQGFAHLARVPWLPIHRALPTGKRYLCWSETVFELKMAVGALG
jgi:hypothetical protein